MKLINLCVLTILMLSGCASPSSNGTNAVTLKNQRIISDKSKNSLMFEKVDGEKLRTGLFARPNKAVHKVSPGLRELSVGVTHTTDTTKVVWAAFFDVTAELLPGRTYVIKSNENNWCMEMKVEDLEGNIVAGPVYKPLGPYLSYSNMQDAATMNLVEARIANTKCEG